MWGSLGRRGFGGEIPGSEGVCVAPGAYPGIRRALGGREGGLTALLEVPRFLVWPPQFLSIQRYRWHPDTVPRVCLGGAKHFRPSGITASDFPGGQQPIPTPHLFCLCTGWGPFLSLLMYTHCLVWVTILVSYCRNTILGHSLSLLLFRNSTTLVSGRSPCASYMPRAQAYYLL